jgi:hypothetical protein
VLLAKIAHLSHGPNVFSIGHLEAMATTVSDWATIPAYAALWIEAWVRPPLLTA